jgi:hypothetical protein
MSNNQTTQATTPRGAKRLLVRALVWLGLAVLLPVGAGVLNALTDAGVGALELVLLAMAFLAVGSVITRQLR